MRPLAAFGHGGTSAAYTLPHSNTLEALSGWKPPMISMRGIATGRIVGLLIAITGILVSIAFACDAMRMNAEFYHWLDARPMETGIDLSKPGEVSVPFHQICSSSHGEEVYLKCDLHEDERRQPETLFKNLSGSLTIRDSDGNQIESVRFDSKTIQCRDGDILVTGFSPFRKGTFVAAVRVDSGVPALAGRPQTIYAKYHLCGLEKMPAVIAGAFALAAGAIGLVAAVCVLPGLLRFGIFHAAPAESK